MKGVEENKSFLYLSFNIFHSHALMNRTLLILKKRQTKEFSLLQKKVLKEIKYYGT